MLRKDEIEQAFRRVGNVNGLAIKVRYREFRSITREQHSTPVGLLF
jgi:hypothetical protein